MSLSKELISKVGLFPFSCILMHKLGFNKISSRLFSRYFGFETSDFDLKIKWVAVEDIKYNYQAYLDFSDEMCIYGRADGRWDMLREPIDQKFLESFRKVFNQNAEWSETAIFEESINRINKGKKVMHCSTIDELEYRFEEIEELYNSLKEKGYVPRYEKDWRNKEQLSVFLGDTRIPDEPRVAIDRKGDLMHINGGSHRVALAKLLGIEEIPVIVQLEHSDFESGALKPEEFIEIGS